MKNTKALFIGGIKSGKSLKAEEFILSVSKSKPLYVATTEFIDKEMKRRINLHKKQRENKFKTKEVPLKLYKTIKKTKKPVLIECISIWINNMLYHGFKFEDMHKELSKILSLKKTIVFVLNDVSTGIIPNNKLAREFVDINGKLSQEIASSCDGVYHVVAGISTKIK
jgi:adenosylcobinamide kinase/adenosylcobinamide-phosphate guanylyltransferase